MFKNSTELDAQYGLGLMGVLAGINRTKATTKRLVFCFKVKINRVWNT
jgi:hypothetical protein